MEFERGILVPQSMIWALMPHIQLLHQCHTVVQSVFLCLGLDWEPTYLGWREPLSYFGQSWEELSQSFGTLSEGFCASWFKVCSTLIPCLCVSRQYGEGKTCSYPKNLIVLQNARFGLTYLHFKDVDWALILAFETFSSTTWASRPLKI